MKHSLIDELDEQMFCMQHYVGMTKFLSGVEKPESTSGINQVCLCLAPIAKFCANKMTIKFNSCFFISILTSTKQNPY